MTSSTSSIQTFVNNLPPSTILDGYLYGINNLINLSTTDPQNLENYLKTLKAGTNPIPTTLVGFINGYFASINEPPPSGVYLQNLINPFIQDYILNTHITQDPSWQALNPPLSADSSSPNYANTVSQFNNWWTQFAQSFPYNVNGSIGTLGSNLSTFQKQMTEELATTASMSNNTTLTVLNSSGAVVTLSNIPSYENVYFLSVPNPTLAGFQTELQTFYSQQLATNGYFLPSQSFSAWQAMVQSPADKTSLASLDSASLLTLNRIYDLIANLLNVLQKTAAAQANRLVLLTQWQQAYTNSLNQLHVFLQSSPDLLQASSGDSQDTINTKSTIRGDLNDQVNANLRELMQNYRSMMGDNAKALQSSVNQTNDAVSQQANMATAIIQELSTILGALFRG